MAIREGAIIHYLPVWFGLVRVKPPPPAPPPHPQQSSSGHKIRDWIIFKAFRGNSRVSRAASSVAVAVKVGIGLYVRHSGKQHD
jgi:hypothetical protein